jgi:predicted hydrocarbon binding protein
MEEEKRIPSLLMNILITQVDEMMGHRSLLTLLRQAELTQYADHIPPLDETPCITVVEYSRFLALVYDIFGAHGAQPIFQRCGRLGAAEIRRQRPTKFALAGTALKLLPAANRMQFILSRLVEQGQEMYGTSHILHDDGDAFVIEMPGCPYCSEVARRNVTQKKMITKPVCHIPLAAIEEMVEWVTGWRHLVEEIECVATGADACRFRVTR